MNDYLLPCHYITSILDPVSTVLVVHSEPDTETQTQ